jgi:hypothetical protein
LCSRLVNIYLIHSSTLIFVVPLELIKCNQQINYKGKTKKENRFFKKAQHIWRVHRYHGMYKGLCVTFNRDVFSYGLYFLIYYGLKDYYKKKGIQFNSGKEAMAGALAGFACWAVTYPIDTMKTIIQTGHVKDKPKTQKEVFLELTREGGFRALFRGALPSLTLSMSFSAMLFAFFEIFKNILMKTPLAKYEQ